MRYAVVRVLAVGNTKRYAIEAFIEGIPDDVKGPEVVGILERSRYASEFSEMGIFLANRKVLPETKVPKTAVADNAQTIEWKALQAKGSTQLNMRVPAQDRALWEMAAARAGLKLTDWAREILNREAGVKSEQEG
ncbi:hypothetical protein [Streptomyces sp. NPDC127197]|uniref:hypothetical protein n=1 Tax=Streptomyces sp. NPDC127197 TaxID=3345388 RepID=UPI003635AB0F